MGPVSKDVVEITSIQRTFCCMNEGPSHGDNIFTSLQWTKWLVPQCPFLLGPTILHYMLFVVLIRM